MLRLHVQLMILLFLEEYLWITLLARVVDTRACHKFELINFVHIFVVVIGWRVIPV